MFVKLHSQDDIGDDSSFVRIEAVCLVKWYVSTNRLPYLTCLARGPKRRRLQKKTADGSHPATCRRFCRTFEVATFGRAFRRDRETRAEQHSTHRSPQTNRLWRSDNFSEAGDGNWVDSVFIGHDWGISIEGEILWHQVDVRVNCGIPRDFFSAICGHAT